ncbi:MAG: hypothetical protein WA324_00275 [Bryobacteraceae bacterium]
MPPDDSPKAKYERLQRRFQEEILSKYPNPERKGCPGDAVLQSLAARPMTEPIEADPAWQHVTHCSECYRAFLGLQTAISSQRRIGRESIRWGIAVAALVLALAMLYVKRGFVFESKRPQNAELAYIPRTIDIPSMARSLSPGGEKKPFYLNRDREALTIQLPVGSRAGQYEFQFRNEAEQVILRKLATAKIDHGATAFRVNVDLAGFQPGRYKMEVRQVPYDWEYFPVILQ